MNENQITDQTIIQKIRETAETRYRRRFRVLARRLGWSLPKLSKLLTGEQPMRLVEFLSLCSVLGLVASHLLALAGA